jgi:hypothetical protein
MKPYFLSLLLTFCFAVRAQDFTSPATIAAGSKYRSAVAQTKEQYIAALKVIVKDVMKSGQLDEANNISKIIANPETSIDTPVNSLRGKAAYTVYKSSVQRASQEYAAALKSALRQSLQEGQLEESNRISAEIKKLEGGAATKPAQGGEIRPTSGDTGKEMAYSIEANNQDGVSVGTGKKGQRVKVQYVDGKWTGLRTGDPVSPDETKSTMHQLTIIGLIDKKEELIVVVPGGTKQRAFSETLKKDYEDIRLRINDTPRGDNSGVVTYKASIK